MQVITIPVLEDNYSYLIIDSANGVAAAVDVVEPEKVIKAAQDHRVKISHILTTHSHWDHAGGNLKMVKLLSELSTEHVPVIGGINDGVQGVTQEVQDNDCIKVGDLSIKVLFTPCHTPGHVLYLCENALFTGDTLFIAGCGRFNSGTPKQMYRNLVEIIAQLPVETNIYCGHEYTVNNLKFAKAVEPDNEYIIKKTEWALLKAKSNQSTIPSTVADELKTNPFLRLSESAVKKYTGKEDPIDVLAALRMMKNSFGSNL